MPLCLEIIAAVIFFIIIYYFSTAVFRGAHFAVSESSKIKKIIKMAGNLSGMKAVDLGSGDGRLVIALAQAGAQVHGYEINPILVLISRWRIKRVGLKGRAIIYRQSYWEKDLSEYNVVAFFGVFYIMNHLEKKLLKELKRGVTVISNFCQFPHWEYISNENKIYLYRKK